MLTSLGLSPSFGFGDRLGLATSGHIAAVKGTKFAPIFAQQSIRENARTGRTPQQMMADAHRGVEAVCKSYNIYKKKMQAFSHNY